MTWINLILLWLTTILQMTSLIIESLRMLKMFSFNEIQKCILFKTKPIHIFHNLCAHIKTSVHLRIFPHSVSSDIECFYQNTLPMKRLILKVPILENFGVRKFNHNNQTCFQAHLNICYALKFLSMNV